MTQYDGEGWRVKELFLETDRRDCIGPGGNW